MEHRPPKAARRALLRCLVAAPALVLAGKSLAEGKVKKSQLQYQDKPNRGQRCAGCSQFIPGKTASAMGTCKLVEGTISPNGWCLEWEAAAKKKG